MQAKKSYCSVSNQLGCTMQILKQKRKKPWENPSYFIYYLTKNNIKRLTLFTGLHYFQMLVP